MNGAQSLVKSLVASGIDTCFANPGTSEMHFVGALDSSPELRSVLCLFEGVATGAADGFARMTGRPAATLLHLGAGLANGASNLHNARRAGSPIVNVVGDHATYHQQYDVPLASDVAGIARPFSHWVHSGTSSRTVGSDAARAVKAAREAPGRIATLILPADTAWSDADVVAPPLPVAGPAPVSDEAVALTRDLLTNGGKSAILLRGHAALSAEGMEIAGRIRRKTGVRLFCDTFAPRIERGAGVIAPERLPYFAEMLTNFLADLDSIILVGSQPPVGFFAYPGKPSWCLPDTCRVHYLAQPHEDGAGALALLADALGASEPDERPALALPDAPEGKLNAFTLGQALARCLPEDAVISDDGATSSGPVLAALATAPRHLHMALTGGSIGQGLPVAIGAAVAAPERKVVCMTGDGAGLYMPQALWTMAREQLDIVTVVFANREYKILSVEMMRVGIKQSGPKAKAMFDLNDPYVDWVSLANGFGVPAASAGTIEEFSAQIEAAMKAKGPILIEAVLV
ncbi:MAG: acetolactate synthase large subunit [Alphaproteobacteria bacterium]|nr:acetolactate synthase large subunit [Alphaproteobacteria bacterium]